MKHIATLLLAAGVTGAAAGLAAYWMMTRRYRAWPCDRGTYFTPPAVADFAAGSGAYLYDAAALVIGNPPYAWRTE